MAVLPRLYVAYMWLIEVTSRHDDRLSDVVRTCVERHGRCVAVLWHQEVFSVAWNYRHLRPHTLANTSDFGRLITRMLELCDFVVFRGGSESKSRRRTILPTLITHMRTAPRVLYGLTVDGSNGPAYRMKPGAVAIARLCDAPTLVVRTWYRFGFELPTWDRTQIPLPFNRRVSVAVGPYWIPPDADPAAREAFRAHVENELLELTARVHEEVECRPFHGPRFGFPAGWTPSWPQGRWGKPFGPDDLRMDAPPPAGASPRASSPRRKPGANC